MTKGNMEKEWLWERSYTATGVPYYDSVYSLKTERIAVLIWLQTQLSMSINSQ
jgi:hypothetical protein